ncbi:unnamed protein product [Rotaria socialis]|uniref:Uncharacterized protein n=1 Tax=Rotaria socialis TaxID=392032 RepID=A0A821R5J0_9BILA|nr:unnamed protein product [Rotaria socialis]CAF4837339.1 unnamed protein product [Rotaria socialis]
MEKAIVIPHTLFAKWERQQKAIEKKDNHLIGLEKDLNGILKSGKPDEDKKIRYTEALRKFLQYSNIDLDQGEKKSIEIPVIDKNPIKLKNDPVYNNLKTVLKSAALQRGQKLYKDLLTRDKDIKWNNNNTVTLQGYEIPSSDIITLIAGAVDGVYAQTHQHAAGKKAFEKWLQGVLGMKYVGLKGRLAVRNTATSSTPINQTVSHFTPPAASPVQNIPLSTPTSLSTHRRPATRQGSKSYAKSLKVKPRSFRWTTYN